MVNPYDPFRGPPDRDPGKPSLPHYRDPEASDWQTYVIGGAVAVLALIGLLWISATETSNQQSAENQPRVEGPADRSPSPPETPAPPPATSP